jgi:hypothetical protein
LGVILGVALGVALWWNGRKTWRGEELAWAERYRSRHGHAIDSPQGPVAGHTGTRRRYGTELGAGHVGLLAGPALLLLTAGWELREVLDEGDDWWLWAVVTWVAAGLLIASFVYFVVYVLLGVPDGLRPPCQRGWEEVGGEPRLVRPEAFHEHARHDLATGRPDRDDRS